MKVAIVGRIRIDENLQYVGHARFRRDPWIRRTKQHYLDLIAMSLAGMAAEQVFLGGHDDGAAGNAGSGPFEATKTAMALERSFGMGTKLAAYGDLNRPGGNGHFDPMLLPRVDGILQKQFDRARHREACTVLADELASRLELSGQEVLDALARQDQNRLSGGSG
ncbi:MULTISPECIES: hypothetical protein [Sinorhizobium]|uniref:hypothetical protein n=1 Tax=Sinorhizobium TaxID=28105 RepID=UPI000BE8F032|nr:MULTISPECIES: hypothetical protein [Sinorhizobium]PDT51200.1 hypothetical protein CO664_22845 [Sinorhizobium sp. NG07B]POH25852.1 hypothetical protein ATY30_27190 [Sinorhizobium americanum]